MKKFAISIGLFLVLFIFTTQTSCKKEVAQTPQNTDTTVTGPTYVEKMFELYVLNSPVIVTQALDTGGINITSQFSDEIITLKKNTYYDGPLEILAGGILYKGTWKANSDYSTLDLNITGKPEFDFYVTSGTWRFTYKSLNILRLAPVLNPLKKSLELQKK